MSKRILMLSAAFICATALFGASVGAAESDTFVPELPESTVVSDAVSEEADGDLLAAGKVSFSLSDTTAAKDSTVRVTLSVDSNSGFASALVKLVYDKDALTLEAIEDAGKFGTTVNNVMGGVLYWNNATVSENFTYTGTAATLVFHVNASAVEGQSYPITLNTDSAQCYDVDMNDVGVSATAGRVKVISSFTVNYDANGGSGAPTSTLKKPGESVSLSTVIPTRTGYIFKGWATQKNGFVVYNPGATYSVDANLTLYAVWEAKTYTISYNANGGSGAPGAQTKTHDVALRLSAVVPTRDGHTFEGWMVSGEIYDAGDLFDLNGDTTLTAVWKAIPITDLFIDHTVEVVKVGGKLTFHTTALPENAPDKTPSWESSDDTVATVDENGVVTGKKEGIVTVTATKDGLTVSCTVAVRAAKTPTEGTPRFVMDNVTSLAGKDIKVNLTLADNPGFASAVVHLYYDESVLTLTKVEDAGKLGDTVHNPTLKTPYILYWNNGTVTENFKVNGTVATLTFHVKDDAPEAVYPILVQVADVVDVDLNDVAIAMVDGSVEVVDYTYGDLGGDGEVNVKDNMILARYLAGWDGYDASTFIFEAADLNGDGEVNVKDNMILARHLAGWEGYETLPVLNK